MVREVSVPVETVFEKVKEIEVFKEVPIPVENRVEKIKEVEITKEIPVTTNNTIETIKEVTLKVEVPVVLNKTEQIIKEVKVTTEKPVVVTNEIEIVKEIEVIQEVPVEVTNTVTKFQEVEVIKEVIKEVVVNKEIPVEVIKEVEVIREVEVIKEVPVEVIKEVQVTKHGEEISRQMVHSPELKTYRTGKERMIRSNRKFTDKVLEPTNVESSKEKDKEDDYLTCAEYKGRKVNDKVNNVALFKHDDGQFYFAMYHADGSVRLRSEGFKNAQQRDEELSGVLRLRDKKEFYTRKESGKFYMDILHDETGREVGRSCLKKKAEAKASPTPTAKAKPASSKATAPKTDEIYTDSVYGLKSDNLQIIEGIGPKINQLLRDAGIKTWRQLAQSTPQRIKLILDDAGTRFKMHNPASWPEQALFAADGEWQELIGFQKVLDSGKDGDHNLTDSKLEKILINKGKIKK